MRNNINILGNNQSFNYLIEYLIDKDYSVKNDTSWYRNGNCVYLLQENIKYYRKSNEWYEVEKIKENFNTTHIPDTINTSKLRVYIPLHNISAYVKGVKYMITANTWINGCKIDLGSIVFSPIDTIANNFGVIKSGNDEYIENIEFDIIDPFSITYSDDWSDFRKSVCDEPSYINNTGSQLLISLYVVNENSGTYYIKDEYVGGITNFNISKETDYLNLKLYIDNESPETGLKFDMSMNSEYNWLLNYLDETYNIDTRHRNMCFEVVIKNSDSVIIGPSIEYSAEEDFGTISQKISCKNLLKNDAMNLFFSNWNNFEEGWNFASSFIVKNDDNDELLSIISNEIPITQEVYSKFINACSEKIIDLEDMNITHYNVVNKIENKIVQIERPTESKANIIQPVFFKVKDAELLTLHPEVTENICINLDDYKNKVERFTLKIDNCRFNQIGANNYGIIFKVTGNKISGKTESGTYYILDEHDELITTGKYNCIR